MARTLQPFASIHSAGLVALAVAVADEHNARGQGTYCQSCGTVGWRELPQTDTCMSVAVGRGVARDAFANFHKIVGRIAAWVAATWSANVAWGAR